MWEVFNWRTGKTIETVTSEHEAKMTAWSMGDDYDYAREGEWL